MRTDHQSSLYSGWGPYPHTLSPDTLPPGSLPPGYPTPQERTRDHRYPKPWKDLVPGIPYPSRVDRQYLWKHYLLAISLAVGNEWGTFTWCGIHCTNITFEHPDGGASDEVHRLQYVVTGQQVGVVHLENVTNTWAPELSTSFFY